MNELAADRRGEWLLLAALLLPLCVLRFSLHSGAGPYGVDGSYYAQIARNVAEGRGLVTNVCLYHQGLDPLPAPTNIYPLWPVLLGMTARVVGWLAALRHLPRVLYVLALLSLYVTARRVAVAEQRIAGPLTVAHLAVVIFGLTPVFFSSTTFPYTEGLAFLLACAALAMAFVRGPWAALLGGIVAGLATLTRSQMLMLVLAVIAARAIEAVRERIWKELLLTIAGAALILVPWIYFVSTLTGTFSWTNLTASYVQTTAIPAYPFGMQSADSTTMVRLKGLWTAFNPWSPNSFFALFGPVVLLVPIAAAHWCYRAFKARPRLSTGVLAFAMSGAFLCFVLALVPMRFFREWLFGWRHGLPLIFLIVLALVELIAFGHRYVRGAAMLIAVASVFWGGALVVRTVIGGPPAGLTKAEHDLSSWLERQPRSTVVLTTNAQTLSPYSHANFRWTACDDSPAATRAMLTLIRTDYVAVYEHEQQCSFARGIRDLVQPAGTFGATPQRILLLRRRS